MPEWFRRFGEIPGVATPFDVVLSGAGIRTVLCNVRTPRMNAIAERWIGRCRRELLHRTLIRNQAHLRHILRDYEIHHNWPAAYRAGTLLRHTVLPARAEESRRCSNGRILPGAASQ